MITLSIINACLFVAIALLHLYWAWGGTWLLNAVIPQKDNHQQLFKPGRLITFAVALVMLFFACVAISAVSVFYTAAEARYSMWGNAGIGLVLLARAIGDFKYVGFFKSVKHTRFANNDTRFFVPLCSCMALVAFAIAYLLYKSHS